MLLQIWLLRKLKIGQVKNEKKMPYFSKLRMLAKVLSIGQSNIVAAGCSCHANTKTLLRINNKACPPKREKVFFIRDTS